MKQNYESPIVTLWQCYPEDICTDSTVLEGTVYDQNDEYWSSFEEN